MAQKLTFSKVVILSFSRKPEGGTVKIACAPSKVVSKAMGWGEVPEWQKDFNDAQGARKLEQYMASVPESAVRVTYEKPAEQEELLTTEEQRQAVLSDE